MENNMDTGYDEFAAAFDGGDGYQTDTAEETAQTETNEETTEEPSGEAQETPESGDSSGEEPVSESEEPGTEGGEKPDEPISEQKFTIKVNKEERQLSIAEMTEFAQKGADYDRVKNQLETSRQSEQTLRAQLDEQQGYMDVLKLISEQTNTPMDQLIDQLHVNFLKGKGMSEAEAKAEIRAAKAEKQLKAVTEQKSSEKAAAENNTARAQRDLAEFRKQFPDVQITQELCEKLAPDIQAGMSMLGAYLKMENARKDAEIAELQRKQAADTQNKKNREKSPGSQTDSGGQRTKSDFDEFMAAFM
ncbi:MAG: hypothetical protein ACI3VA_07135 [Candidatus Limivicinus sp.]